MANRQLSYTPNNYENKFKKDKSTIDYKPSTFSKDKNTVDSKPPTVGAVPSVFPNTWTVDVRNTPLSYENRNVRVNNGLLPSYESHAGLVKNTSKSSKDLQLGDYNYDDIYNEIYYDDSSSRGGASKVDVSELLNAYKMQNAAANATAQQAYDSQRDALLQNIKRAYAENEKAVLQQNQNFISSQASLEDANSANARNARVGLSLNGLNGSGVQQLAQLKNLISQANQIGTVSDKNAAALEKLRNSLATSDEKVMSNLESALNNYNKQVLSNNNSMASNSANTVMDAETAYAKALANSGSSSSSGSTFTLAANMVANTLKSTTDSLKDNINYISTLSTKGLKAYAEENGIDLKNVDASNYKSYISKQLAKGAEETLASLNESYPINSSVYNQASNNIYNILKYYN